MASARRNELYKVAAFVIGLLTGGTLFAQSCGSSILDGATPVGVAPGSPAGSYALSDFDTVNCYSGTLNIRLPLAALGGRGDGGYRMILPPQNTRFIATKFPDTANPGLFDYYVD